MSEKWEVSVLLDVENRDELERVMDEIHEAAHALNPSAAVAATEWSEDRPPDWPNWLRPPEEGERCFCCGRRRNKKRKPSSPTETRKVKAGELPAERADWVDEALDGLQEYVAADLHSYPRGSLVEGLLVLGGQHREELRAHFDRRPLDAEYEVPERDEPETQGLA